MGFSRRTDHGGPTLALVFPTNSQTWPHKSLNTALSSARWWARGGGKRRGDLVSDSRENNAPNPKLCLVLANFPIWNNRSHPSASLIHPLSKKKNGPSLPSTFPLLDFFSFFFFLGGLLLHSTLLPRKALDDLHYPSETCVISLGMKKNGQRCKLTRLS